MDRDQWLAERSRGLGGSDAAAALGLSKWKTPYQLYLEKRGESPPIEETEPMRWGKILEPVIIQRYADVTGRDVRTFPNEMIWHPTLPFMFVSPDGVSGERYVEAKTARTSEQWGEPGSDEIPQEYLIQVQHALLVMKLSVADVPVLFGGSDFQVYEVPADRELQEMVQDGEADFWRRVERGEPPDPVTLDDVQQRYGRRSVPQGVQASPDIAALCHNLGAVKAEIKRGEELAERFEVQIKSALGENETLLHGRDVLATWKLDAKGRERFDTAGLKERFPEIYSMFVGAQPPSRRFLLKTKGQ